MTKRITILHYAAPPIVGGVESTIYHHSLLLASAGHTVRIIAGRGEQFREDITLHIVPELNSSHTDVLKIGKSLAHGVVNEEFMNMRARLFDKLCHLLVDTDVCIVHNALTLHKNLPLTAALHQVMENQITPLIAWCHDFAWQDPLYKPHLHPGFPWDLLRSKWQGVHYVTVSEHRRKRLADLFGIGKEEITVVPPGISVAEFLKFDPLTVRIMDHLNLFNSEPILLLPARITRRKNIEFAIRVAGEVKRELPGVALVITGPPGPHNPANLAYLESLLTLKKELDLVDNVHFLYELGKNGLAPHIPDEVIADLFQIADILIFPSQREGFGIPVLEAGLARAAVFAADIPVMRESSRGHASLFNLSVDPSEVGQEIVTYIRTNQAYQLRKVVLSDYSWESIVDKKVIPLIERAGNSS